MRDPMSGLLKHVVQRAPFGDINSAISLFDEYCEDNGLGMNLGVEKGDVIEATVRDALERHDNDTEAFAVLEVGAHFGDGTLRVLRALQAPGAPASKVKAGGPVPIVISLESNAGWASGCKALAGQALGGAGGVRHVSLVAQPAAIVTAAEAALADLRARGSTPSFHLVLLDHEHGKYLRDLKGLLHKRLLAPGGIVHADNAGRDADVLKEYLAYVQGGGPFSTRFEEIERPYPDLVAISTYEPAGEGAAEL
mmetsp:Transcript_55474/g.171862  ORF Transcript_55474/g.171862 Transcript_55474/m.171862 type:complete len:252 (+) Transcript_55474:618-1373(+)